MGTDRITELRIAGLRTIDRLRLPLDGLTVLIGENGSGKSSILEACELLRRAASPAFMSELHSIHGGMWSLLRHGAAELRLGVTVEGSEAPPLHYDVTLVPKGVGAIITEESLQLGPGGHLSNSLGLIVRDEAKASIYEPLGPRVLTNGAGVTPTHLVLGSAGDLSAHEGLIRMKRALESIEVHVPFEVVPSWIAQAHQRKSEMRTYRQLEPTDRLGRLGENLVSAYHALRTEYPDDHWKTTMGYVRLGLGDHVESVNARSGGGGGAVSVWLKLQGRDEQLPASALSDGELAYLAFVALNRLQRPRALLAFDEPELHLHPGLLARVVGLFEDLAERQPVLLATHSDRLLDMLAEPARSVVVCEVEGPDRKTRLRRLDPEMLKAWAESYRSLGQVRSEGFLSLAFKDEDP